ncbi:carboxymuconolactone decarboxylase family protein [Roseomonas stagni]|uniref:Carboxymuconolactone decarboxylase family protein n=1 Tax=Falsiroseomonas algicola TaxID=2716930 RepID=A0A6M1LFS1_9PROT|nr:carboxymuconolactone decarboxylase family protein [Falsiroseomonas algicola]NGM19145.1 carboxymuconolactone decarboxylase family protein [Falsiroseomonas algicola]
MPNPAITPLPRAAMEPRWRSVAETADQIRGESTLIEVLAQAPELLAWYYDGFYAEVFFKGRVERRVKEVLRLSLSIIHGCAFCNKGNTKSALDAGVTPAQIDAIGDIDNPVFDDRDRAVMRLAAEMALPNMQGECTPALQAELRSFFNEAEIVELAMVAAVLTGMAKMLFVFDLVSREATCPIGPRSQRAS